jgi:hypothetical protein
MRIAKITAVLAAVAGLVMLAALPAGAIDRNLEVWQVSGSYAMYTGGSTDGNIVYLGQTSGAHDFGIVQQSGGYDDPEGLCRAIENADCAIVQLYAGDDPNTGHNECVAATTSNDVVKLKPCSGSDGVNWSELCQDPNCSHVAFINNWQSTLNGSADIVLSSTNSDGADFAIRTYAASGWLQSYFTIAS